MKCHCNAQLALKLIGFTLDECATRFFDPNQSHAIDPDRSVSIETDGHLLAIPVGMEQVEGLTFLRQDQGGFGLLQGSLGHILVVTCPVGGETQKDCDHSKEDEVKVLEVFSPDLAVGSSGHGVLLGRLCGRAS